jgi:hypothetical protein
MRNQELVAAFQLPKQNSKTKAVSGILIRLIMSLSIFAAFNEVINEIRV